LINLVEKKIFLFATQNGNIEIIPEKDYCFTFSLKFIVRIAIENDQINVYKGILENNLTLCRTIKIDSSVIRELSIAAKVEIPANESIKE